MKAIFYHKYGSPDVLELKEVEKPIPKDTEVLIKVHAASLNGSDWENLTGKPLYARFGGLLKPKNKILGSDIAGKVESVGRSVKRFQPGDEVLGDILYSGSGGFAEYVCAPEHALVPKPTGMTFEEAATLPQGAVIALQGIRDKGQVQPGQKVLINGAGGSAGTFAVQLAKLYGAETTGVDRALKFDMLRSLGADHVMDYTREDFTKTGQHYDLILDVVAHRSAFDCKRALSPGGKYFLVGGSVARLLQVLLLGSLIGRSEGKKIRILGVRPNTKDLAHMTELFAAGKIVPIIDRCYPLSEAADALRYLGEGKARGKIVITLEHDD